ncbi:F0F1 ATP synthase subunit A [Stratiformator vulcanicus]|uniref:ATP synthase subunit a n=1 Tax=Stratiformator vulcanicus TaxID=2527980 RepID=A0A517R1G1_9PLAN|nr:F0F1 ATP synthase subunit A [Stratiformator vulcanicus]QDT37727.1 ATP synthase subunit a [Stratiformator vulcanicus]
MAAESAGAETAGPFDVVQDTAFHHVADSGFFELPMGGELEIPGFLLAIGITKYVILQFIAFALAFLVFSVLARKMRSGQPIKGRFWNFWEVLCVYLRDEVVRPTIGDPHAHQEHGDGAGEPEGQFDPGHSDPLKEANAPFSTRNEGTELPTAELGGHPADVYLPVIWSLFFFILFCNLLGAIPYLGSPTGNLFVTGVLALFVFGYVVWTGSKQSGFVGFFKSLVPGMELPGIMKPILIPMIWVIEFFGLLVKHFVLAVRLFANMLAGHMVVGAILGFIGVAATFESSAMFGAITTASIVGQVFIGLLELFVAFLQAYIFAFLATLFISSAVHPH